MNEGRFETMAESSWTKFERAVPVALTDKALEELGKIGGVAMEELRRYVDETHDRSEIWKNNRYQVTILRTLIVPNGWPPIIHLSIKRLDRQPIHDWRDLQRIKNELFGSEHEGVEVYPAESLLVDTANQYHLWIFADADATLPFGFTQRLVSNETSVGGAIQRPR